MPSPFPGMDPYIEDPAIFPDLHQSLIYNLRDAIQPQVTPRYYARIGERVYVTDADRDIGPDVMVMKGVSTGGSGPRPGAERADSPVVVTLSETERTEGYIEVHDSQGGDRLVTVIEVLSPANKRKGSRGLRLYRRKQEEVLASGANLVEIDLLRKGVRVAALPPWKLDSMRPFSYVVVISRAPVPNRREVYPIPLRNPLPRIGIPLGPEDPDAVVNLQTLFNRCYDATAFHLSVNYGRPPRPPLPSEDAAWTAEVLKSPRG